MNRIRPVPRRGGNHQLRAALTPAVAAVVVALGSMALPAPVQAASPSAGPLTCGARITHDTTLTNDLLECPTAGLIIGRNKLTLDLGGHTVTGTGGGIGIDNTGGFADVTITNGSVQHFGDGVLIVGAASNSVRRVDSSGNAHGGVGFDDATSFTAKANTTSNEATGIYVVNSRNGRIIDNVARDIEQGCIPLFGSSTIRVTGNSLTRCVNGPGIGLFDDSDNNTIDHNTIADSGEGIGLNHDSDHNQLTANDAAGSLDGALLDVGTHHNTLSDNNFHDNTYTGIVLFGSSDNRLIGNKITRNHEPAEGGIHLFQIPEGTSDRNQLTGNITSANDGDGILIDAGQQSNTITRNLSTRNGDDGIDVDSAATTISTNVATFNQDLGIEAVPGVTDQGGNVAYGNGAAAQCANVTCRPR